jgi:hypothetical protein
LYAILDISEWFGEFCQIMTGYAGGRMLQFEHQMADAYIAQIQQPKELTMFTRRLFNVFVFVALLVVVGLTVREAAATAQLVSHAKSVEPACASLPSLHSIRTEYVPERGVWMTYTEDGPTGVDGGLIHLLSEYRACSR